MALTDYLATGVNDPTKQVSVTKWNNLLGELAQAVDGRLTPAMFGAVPYDPDNEVDSTDALNAFYAYFRDDEVARHFIADADGEWMTTDTIIAAYETPTTGVIRRFKAPILRVAPGVVPEYALEIAGHYLKWEGTTGVYPTGATYRDNTYRTYANRTFVGGVRVRACSNSIFGSFDVQCAKRSGLFVSSSESSGFTLDGINFINSNCIGSKFDVATATICGSNYRQSEVVITANAARIQGGKTGTNFSSEGFVSGTGGLTGSSSQRTQIPTASSLSDVRVYDLIWCRVELTAAIYGTIACDNGASTITWSAGDPTAFNGAGAGLEVGDIYPPFAGGPDAGDEFRIVSFGGTSNRTITVTPAPTTLAATASATYNQNSRKSWHWVSAVNASDISVYPWVADRINSTFHVVHGYVVKTDGGDVANITFAGAMGNLCGGAYHSKGLFASKMGTVLAQATNIGVRLADPVDNGHIGFNVEHGHCGTGDGCDVSILSGASNIYGTINLESDFTLASCESASPRTSTNQQRPGSASGSSLLGDIKLGSGANGSPGMWLETAGGKTYEGSTYNSFPLSNAKRNRQAYIHTDTATIEVQVDRNEPRFFPKHHWSELIWTDSDGSAPDGTLTLNLEASLAALGWTFAGAGSGTSYAITAPASTVMLKLQTLFASKKVTITRVNGA